MKPTHIDMPISADDIERRKLAAASADQAATLYAEGALEFAKGNIHAANALRLRAENWVRMAEYLLNGETPDE